MLRSLSVQTRQKILHVLCLRSTLENDAKYVATYCSFIYEVYDLFLRKPLSVSFHIVFIVINNVLSLVWNIGNSLHNSQLWPNTFRG